MFEALKLAYSSSLKRRYVNQKRHFPIFCDYVKDYYVIGHGMIGFSDTPNARSQLDERALEVRFCKYYVHHNF